MTTRPLAGNNGLKFDMSELTAKLAQRGNLVEDSDTTTPSSTSDNTSSNRSSIESFTEITYAEASEETTKQLALQLKARALRGLNKDGTPKEKGYRPFASMHKRPQALIDALKIEHIEIQNSFSGVKNTLRYINDTIIPTITSGKSEEDLYVHDSVLETRIIQKFKSLKDFKITVKIPSNKELEAKLLKITQRHFENLNQLIDQLESPEYYKGQTTPNILLALVKSIIPLLTQMSDKRRNEEGFSKIATQRVIDIQNQFLVLKTHIK